MTGPKIMTTKHVADAAQRASHVRPGTSPEVLRKPYAPLATLVRVRLELMGDPRFDDFVKEFRTTGGCAKLGVGTPVLVRLGSDAQGAGSLGFRTQTCVEPNHGSEEQLGAVTFIAKKMGGAFPDQIGVGRATNTDLHLPLPGISKYHAFFSLAADGSHTITDVGSKNGTCVNDTPLVPKKAARLADGDLLSLGATDFVFHTYQGFMRRIAEAARR